MMRILTATRRIPLKPRFGSDRPGDWDARFSQVEVAILNVEEWREVYFALRCLQRSSASVFATDGESVC